MKKQAFFIKAHLEQGIGNTKNAVNYLTDSYPTLTTTTLFDEGYDVTFLTSDPEQIETMIKESVRFNKCKLAELIKVKLSKSDLSALLKKEDDEDRETAMEIFE